MRIFGCPTKTLDSHHQDLIKRALKLGYTHLDLAWLFPKQRDLKKLFPEISRSEYKVIMKVMPGLGLEPIVHNFDNFIDIMLIHWPGIYNLKPNDPKNITARHEHYKKMEDFQKQGLIGEIGTSNFNHSHLRQLLDVCEIKPAYN